MLDRNDPKPLHQQLREILEDAIESGKWGPDEKIPSENELSSMYGLSRMTVRSVLTELVREGWLYRVQGKGTFVSEKIETLSPAYIGIREQLEKMGYEISTKIIEIKTEKGNQTVTKRLKLQPYDLVYKIKRVRYIRNEPISIHISYVSPKYSFQLTKENLEKEQLCVILNEEYGLQRKRVDETLESVSASSEEAKLLNTKKDRPLLLLRDVIYSSDGLPFEYTKVIFKGDKIKIKLTYES
ncbi:GntR family transcriptional regulator [Pseudoramibacter faecis]|uniref:GntR family transcriptional regulator n=1 Tax=Pseudoramibacter faecis TaxID=3108534 RepID=UPI002E775D66|nr:GntR family transcriptional regulator [Pseudoramibacter sp. HA2172]